MAQCVVIGIVDGQEVIQPSYAEPCTSILLLEPQEYAAWMASPLNLSASEGALLSVAILSVWACAWAFRALIRALGRDGEALD